MSALDQVFDWSPQQLEALDRIHHWLEDSCWPVFKLFGFAGTGKTTLARYAVEGRNAIFTAYTGKAAAVLRQAGCYGAKNIHQYLYKSKSSVIQPPNDEELIARDDLLFPEVRPQLRRERLDFDVTAGQELKAAEVIVVDEASMITKEILDDLLKLEVPILALGDPAQLPPIGEDNAGLASGDPDFFLTEIHRQASGNPIIELSMRARQGKYIPWGWYGQSRVCSMTLEDIARAPVDQILVGCNRTRIALNRMIRESYGRYSWVPEPGERLVCLHNMHRLGGLNGTLWHVRQVMTGIGYETRRELLKFVLEPDDGDGPLREFTVPPDEFFTFFDFGYALTVHKAQGSQWPRVLVVNESYCFRDRADRWLYTALTRAKDAVILAWRAKTAGGLTNA